MACELSFSVRFKPDAAAASASAWRPPDGRGGGGFNIWKRDGATFQYCFMQALADMRRDRGTQWPWQMNVQFIAPNVLDSCFYDEQFDRKQCIQLLRGWKRFWQCYIQHYQTYLNRNPSVNDCLASFSFLRDCKRTLYRVINSRNRHVLRIHFTDGY